MNSLRLRILAIVTIAAVGLACLPRPQVCTCLLQGSVGGAHAGSFTVGFTPNPTPESNQGHSSAQCSSSCNPQPGVHCKINGTMRVHNNSSYTITVHWKGETGGTPIAPGASGDFVTGYVTLPCGQTKDVEFDAGVKGIVAHYQWKCNSCAEPPSGI